MVEETNFSKRVGRTPARWVYLYQKSAFQPVFIFLCPSFFFPLVSLLKWHIISGRKRSTTLSHAAQGRSRRSPQSSELASFYERSPFLLPFFFPTFPHISISLPLYISRCSPQRFFPSVEDLAAAEPAHPPLSSPLAFRPWATRFIYRAC